MQRDVDLQQLWLAEDEPPQLPTPPPTPLPEDEPPPEEDDAEESLRAPSPRPLVGGGPDVPNAEATYVELVPTRIREDDEEETDDPEFCFLCTIGEQPDLRRNCYVQRLQQMLEDHYDQMSPAALTSMAQTFYNRQLRDAIDDPQMRKPWFKRVIWEHLHQHSPQTNTLLMQSIRVMQTAMNLLQARGLAMRPVGADASQVRLDATNTKLYLSLNKSTQDLLQKLENRRAAKRQRQQ